ncbi:MAG: VOC family protein [Myxococcota bacterium]
MTLKPGTSDESTVARGAHATNHVLGALLREFDVAPIESRLPREFFYRHGLAFPQQYGIACRDVAECVRLAESLGAGPFLRARMNPPNWVERGERKRCTLEFALGYAQDVQIEFLGPGEGTQHYAAALTDTEVALHHVGIYQRGIDHIAERLEAEGYTTAVTGGLSLGAALTIDFRYFDARKAHGLYLEVLDFKSFGFPLSTEPAIRAYSALVRRMRARTTRG